MRPDSIPARFRCPFGKPCGCCYPYTSRPRPRPELHSHKNRIQSFRPYPNHFQPAHLAPSQQVLISAQQGLSKVPAFQGFTSAGPVTPSCYPAAPASPALPPASRGLFPHTRHTSAASSAQQVHPGRRIPLPLRPRISWMQNVLRSPP